MEALKNLWEPNKSSHWLGPLCGPLRGSQRLFQGNFYSLNMLMDFQPMPTQQVPH